MMIPPARLSGQEAGEAEEIEVAGWAHYYHDWVEAARRGGMLWRLSGPESHHPLPTAQHSPDIAQNNQGELPGAGLDTHALQPPPSREHVRKYEGRQRWREQVGPVTWDHF